jgi:nitrogen PTS system EIIA component
MKLHEVFTSERIKLHMSSHDKDEAFEELVALLSASSVPARRESILSIIRERENKMSTGIKKGIAIPHGKIPGGERIEGVLGISDGGIDYDALDQNPVHIIFLFTSGDSMTDEHLEVLRGISKIAEHPGVMDEIRKATSPEAVNRIIRVFEESDSRDLH